MKPAVPPIGGRYGKLTILERLPKSPTDPRLVKVKCDCGKEFVVRFHNLRNKNTVSCGCARQDANKKRAGRIVSEETRKRLAEKATFNWRGGRTAESFARVLCSAGFVREHCVKWGDARNERFVIDFAHLKCKIAIELDGPGHKSSIKDDALRDKMLNDLGWKVIRIRH